MKEIKTEAIVLHSRTIGEDDLLVDFLTPEEGRLTGMARHGRKSQKRFGTVLEVPNIVSLLCQDRGGRVSVQESVLQKPLGMLANDLPHLLAAFYLIDIVREMVQPCYRDPRLYSLLQESLVALDAGLSPRQVVGTFELGFLDLQGYHPRLEECVACGKKWEEEGVFTFVYRDGGIICSACLVPSRGEGSPFSKKKLSVILGRFLEYQTGRPFRSKRVLRSL